MRKLREDAGYTQQQVAAEARMSRGTVKAVEQGVQCTPSSCTRYADAVLRLAQNPRPKPKNWRKERTETPGPGKRLLAEYAAIGFVSKYRQCLKCRQWFWTTPQRVGLCEACVLSNRYSSGAGLFIHDAEAD